MRKLFFSLLLCGFLAWPAAGGLRAAHNSEKGGDESTSRPRINVVRPESAFLLRNRVDNLERQIVQLEEKIRFLEERTRNLDRRIDDLRQHHL